MSTETFLQHNPLLQCQPKILSAKLWKYEDVNICTGKVHLIYFVEKKNQIFDISLDMLML